MIRSVLVDLVSRQHVVLLGPPGTGKSRLVRDICSRIGGNHLEWLLTRMSTPEELFAPISLKALEQDSYRRVTTGKLPEAEMAYRNETFKGSSAILNTCFRPSTSASSTIAASRCSSRWTACGTLTLSCPRWSARLVGRSVGRGTQS